MFDHSCDGGLGEREYFVPDPCASRANQGEFMDPTDRDSCLADPFVFLSDLLDTSALSWTRLLGFIEEVSEPKRRSISCVTISKSWIVRVYISAR
jgi:hypothetical protein